jgi:hypothetical protein
MLNSEQVSGLFGLPLTIREAGGYYSAVPA